MSSWRLEYARTRIRPVAVAVAVATLTTEGVAASPIFVEVSPPGSTVTTNDTVILEGTVTGATALDLNGTAVALSSSRFATLPLVLHEGTNSFVLTAVDGQGGSTQMTHRIERHSAPHSPTMDPTMPASVDGKSGTLIAQYGYRGAHTLQTRTVGGLTTQRTFDAARRPVHIHTGAPNAPPVLSERIAWDPRGLKSAIQRDDLGGAGHLMSYDGAHRLVASARVGQPLALVGPNTLADVSSVTGQPNHEAFTYDSAMNQTDRLVSKEGVVTSHPTPNDGSGRNRPASVNGVPLIWDDNGNLRQKGDMVMSYDFRNRLTTVERGGEVVVEYTYDALNRRVAREASGVTETYAWDGNQEVETTRDGLLTSRRVYGAGIDETVMVSRDTNGDGSIDSSYLTMFDSSNNLAVVTTLAGKPIERYEASAFGERRILVDSTPPAVEQVRTVADALWLEISESVVGTELQAALVDGTLRLRDIAADEDLALSVEQPVIGGGQTLRRIVITPDTELIVGTSLELVVEPGALVDAFANTPSSTYTLPITWPSADTILVDTASPRVGTAIVRDGIVELELSEEVDPASTAITLDGAAVAWTLSGDHYTLLADQPLATGSHTLTVDTAPLDLAGSGLAEPFQVTFTVAAQDARFVYSAPDEREIAVSTLGNDIGFHGRPVDEATGLMYFRNRWFDPELGRFITADPLGYVDGPSQYQFAGYSPANYSDPLGLYCMGMGAEDKTCADYIPEFETGYYGEKNQSHVDRSQDMSLSESERMRAAMKANLLIPFVMGEELLRYFANAPHDFAVHNDAANAARARYEELVASGMEPLQAMKVADPNGYLVGGPGIAMMLGRGPLLSVSRYRTKKMIGAYSTENLRNGGDSILPYQVRYLRGQVERERFRVTVRDGKLVDASGKLVDTRPREVGGRGGDIFVMDEYGNIYVGPRFGEGLHHSSFFAGGPVAAAGEIRVRAGVIEILNNQTGHYFVGPTLSRQVVDEMTARGIDLSQTRISFR